MRYGLIGSGVMGGAVAKALRKKVDGEELLVADLFEEKACQLAEELSCRRGSNEEAAQCDYVVMAVKPQMMREVLSSLRKTFQQRKDPFVLVSMAAGVSIRELREMSGWNGAVIRIMPNTPVAVGEGMILYASSGAIGDEVQDFLRDMEYAGILDELPEALMDAASSVSGCGPAWCFQMIEALADGGVACGLPRQKAQLYAAQMMKGSAALLLQSGKHPGALKDAVCSPGGTTIQGVRVLEEKGFRGTVTDAVIAAYDKTRNLGK